MIDSHMHIFDVGALRGGDSSARYIPERSALFDDYRKLSSPTGVDGALLVQPSFLKTDNSFLLRHLATQNTSFGRFGVAVVDPRTPPETLEALHSAGVVGIRFNLVQTDDEALRFERRLYASLWKTLDALGMHVELHVESDRLMKVVDALYPHVPKIVIDHFMRPSEGLRGFITKTPSIYKEIAQYGDEGKLWVKTSAAYRVVPDAPHREAVRNCADLAEMLTEMLGSRRLLWGSDWPYTQNAEKVEGTSPDEQYRNVAATRELWTKGGTLYDPDEAFRELTGF